ncbi:unnamed protein product [Meloidogyne enterolobii]|uniref:Uncharacterized protein n=1 Tax=Meloidogyne enterolobii TaxID=390850 RepID=A0ACB1AX62_MELEN
MLVGVNYEKRKIKFCPSLGIILISLKSFFIGAIETNNFKTNSLR